MKRNEIKIMGIVNLTDNSYYAASRCLAHAAADVSDNATKKTGDDTELETMTAKALERIGKILDEGADIIDIGACSTRPGSEPVGEEEEWRRLEPVLKAVRERFPETVVSVDTYWASMVEKTAALFGVTAREKFIVNDISAGEDDPDMLPTVGRLGLRYIAMHKRGTPKTMQNLCQYDDVVGEVVRYFHEFAAKADRYGIKDWILDPGFGFAKTIEQNYQLLAGLSRFSKENFAVQHAAAEVSGESWRNDGDGYAGCAEFHPEILVGVSRKSMIYKLFDITPEDSLPATQVLHYAALQNGATILRVHDVAEAVRTKELFTVIAREDAGRMEKYV